MKDRTYVNFCNIVILCSFVVAFFIFTVAVNEELHSIRAERTANSATECKSRTGAKSAVIADLGKKEQMQKEKKK